jgi:hypothetical protein
MVDADLKMIREERTLADRAHSSTTDVRTNIL